MKKPIFAGVYQLRNVATGDLYVGGSIDVLRRWQGHRTNFRAGTHSYAMQAAFREHGKDSFVFELLLICDPGDVSFFERRAIAVLKPKYNGKLVGREEIHYGHYSERL